MYENKLIEELVISRILHQFYFNISDKYIHFVPHEVRLHIVLFRPKKRGKKLG